MRTVYRCAVCGYIAASYPDVVRHFEEKHWDRAPSHWLVFKYEGRRYPAYKKYRDLRDEGLIEVVKG